jgi:hypothetical protein
MLNRKTKKLEKLLTDLWFATIVRLLSTRVVTEENFKMRFQQRDGSVVVALI